MVKRASIALYVALLCAAASAEESYVAYAEVVDVEPLFEARRVPVRRQVCRWAEESASELAEQPQIADTACTEAKVLSDNHDASAELLDEHAFDELVCGKPG